VDSIAILPLGGREGSELNAMLHEAGVTMRVVSVLGRTRSNITVAEADGTVTKLNEPGTALSAAERASLAAAVSAPVQPGDWVVLSGSVPPEFTSEQLIDLVGSLAGRRVNLAIDTSGDALVASLAARPRLIKPNRAELEEMVGHRLLTLSAVITAASSVRDQGVEFVLVSLGSEGAVLVGPDVVIVGNSEVAQPRSTVGAGDCFLAGFLSRFDADETDLDAAFLTALAWGAAAAALPGTAVPAPADIDYTRVRLVPQPDLDRSLVAS
jgi:1-phosphofructokinase